MTNFKSSKICTKCNVEKLSIEFHNNKSGKYGLTTRCKDCNKEKAKEYYQDNKEKKNEYDKKYRENNKEYRKKYYQDNKERTKEVDKKYRENNKEKKKEYYQNNKEKIIENNKEYIKKRRLKDPLFKLKGDLRSLIGTSIRRKGYKKNSNTFNILGCEYSFFIKYMKEQFKDGMTWENHGEWHIDHIIPMYAAQTEEEALVLNHYTNFQPLWAEENLYKSNKIITKQLKFL